MLRAGEVVKARRDGGRYVPRAVHVGVDQRCIAPPILGRRVREEDLWHLAPSRKALEQAIHASSNRVGARRFIEWKGVAHRRVQRGRGLSEALVEVTATF